MPQRYLSEPPLSLKYGTFVAVCLKTTLVPSAGSGITLHFVSTIGLACVLRDINSYQPQLAEKLTYHEGIGAGAAKVSGDVSPVMFTLLYFDTGVELASKQDILAVSSFTPSVIT